LDIYLPDVLRIEKEFQIIANEGLSGINQHLLELQKLDISKESQ